jgi:hypothetical protein
MDSNQNLRCQLRVSSLNYQGHLHFILFADQSDTKVYRSWNSWGYFARSFKALDSQSRTYEIKRRPEMTWFKNAPTTQAIKKGDFSIEDIYLCDGTWRISPLLPLPNPAGSPVVELQMTGTFQSPADEDAVRTGVWTGEINSAPVKYALGEECIERLNSDHATGPVYR